jgi:hypothetical protein
LTQGFSEVAAPDLPQKLDKIASLFPAGPIDKKTCLLSGKNDTAALPWLASQATD